MEVRRIWYRAAHGDGADDEMEKWAIGARWRQDIHCMRGMRGDRSGTRWRLGPSTEWSTQPARDAQRTRPRTEPCLQSSLPQPPRPAGERRPQGRAHMEVRRIPVQRREQRAAQPAGARLCAPVFCLLDLPGSRSGPRIVSTIQRSEAREMALWRWDVRIQTLLGACIVPWGAIDAFSRQGMKSGIRRNLTNTACVGAGGSVPAEGAVYADQRVLDSMHALSGRRQAGGSMYVGARRD
ncbi:hypothetical protein BJ912DRAFT_1072269 [Pholiota molesta]|nr:hypothetical protein BJ912DRAFT_1072269 [Pholiota molesta]